MRNFLYVLGGAAVASLWWVYGVGFDLAPGARSDLLGACIMTSSILLGVLVMDAYANDKL